MPRNVEVKVRVQGRPDIEARVAALASADAGTLRQTDTYFATPPGRGRRLKLREEVPGAAALIAYERPLVAGLRESRYVIVPVTEPAALGEALGRALGVTARVVKTRRLFLRGRTRIHLDRVEGLGDFLELEVVLAPGEPAGAGEREAEELLAALGLGGAPRIAGSYAELAGPGT